MSSKQTDSCVQWVIIKKEVIEELCESLLSRYQIGLETSKKGKDLIIVLIYYIISVIK